MYITFGLFNIFLPIVLNSNDAKFSKWQRLIALWILFYCVEYSGNKGITNQLLIVTH